MKLTYLGTIAVLAFFAICTVELRDVAKDIVWFFSLIESVGLGAVMVLGFACTKKENMNRPGVIYMSMATMGTYYLLMVLNIYIYVTETSYSITGISGMLMLAFVTTLAYIWWRTNVKPK